MINFSEGITATIEPRQDAPKGLGDFQRRSNREWDRGWRRGGDPRDNGSTSSRTTRSQDAPSVRVPNVGWESTPRRTRGEEGDGWGREKNRRWDAPTPRVIRGGSPDGEDGAFAMDMREWEDEQVKLDRDWYSGAEEGNLAGDEEHNPLAKYDDLSIVKDAEIAKKQVVSSFFIRIRVRPSNAFSRKKFRHGRLNM